MKLKWSSWHWGSCSNLGTSVLILQCCNLNFFLVITGKGKRFSSHQTYLTVIPFTLDFFFLFMTYLFLFHYWYKVHSKFCFSLQRCILTEETFMTLLPSVTDSVTFILKLKYSTWLQLTFHLMLNHLLLGNNFYFAVFCSTRTWCSWRHLWKENISIWIFYCWNAIWDIQWGECEA